VNIGMDISFFRRGIQLPRRSKPDPTKEISPPSRVAILLRQDTGSPYTKTVEIGDAVKVGQKVAESSEGGVDLHASVSGEVKAVESFFLSDGTTSDAIVIESDGMDHQDAPVVDADSLAAGADDLLERIRAAGIIISGPESTSLFNEIQRAANVGQIVVRFCDPDPLLRALDVITTEIYDSISTVELGVEVLKKVTGAGSVCFAFDKKQNAEKLLGLAKKNKWAVRRFNARQYPTLCEPMIFRTVRGKEIDISVKRAVDEGLLIVDVDTILEVAQAAKYGQPVIEKKIVVTGPKGSRTLKVPIGTYLSHIVAQADCSDEIGEIVLGGPMRGKAHHTLDYPLTKDVDGVTIFAPEDTAIDTNDSCISCGLCAKVCPMRLLPGMLSRYCEFGKWEDADKASLFTCIECGCCGYVCPSGRSMVQLLVHGKSEFLAMQRSDS
jgi:electron transport complex protein RnfC